MAGSRVDLLIYDLSGGLATAFSTALLGRQIDGVWHTSIVVFEREYYFGSGGVQACEVGGTVLGQPRERITLGETFVPYSLFREYLEGLSSTIFHGSQYSLFKHNCNTFSNELANFLCGKSIPKYILDLPDTILDTQLGQTFAPLALGLENSLTASNSFGNRPAAKKSEVSDNLGEKKNKKKKSKDRKIKKRDKALISGNRIMAEAATDYETNGNGLPEIKDVTAVTKKARDVVAEIEEEERRELEEQRKKQRDPPVVFRDALDIRVEFDALVGLIDGKLNNEEQLSLEELHMYMLQDEGSWALGDSFLLFIGRLLHDRSLPAEVRVRTLNVLAIAALKDDVILVLHQDRRDHVIMNYASDVERLTAEEQQALAYFFANLFENVSTSEWLLYISEWQFCGNTLSNIRVTVKVAVNALLSDVANLQRAGAAIIHNMACKEVFDDVAVELTMALLQYLNSGPDEEQLFRVLKALARFCTISGQEVPQLIQMIGPDPNKFNGASDRVNEQIQIINSKIR